MKSKQLREQRAKLVQDARDLADGVPAGQAMPAETEAKFDELMAKADTLKAQIDKIERLEDTEAQLAARIDRRAQMEDISPDEAAALDKLEKQAFRAYLRRGIAGMTDEERAVALPRLQLPRNAQSTTTTTAGGYTVPQGFYDRMIDAQKAYGGMIGVSFTLDTEIGNAIPIPTDNDTSNVGAILGENTQVGTQDVTFGAVTLNAHTYTSKLILVSNQLLQDSAFNLDDFLAQKMGTRIGRASNAHFTTGDGASKPTGFLTDAILGATGANGQTTSILFDDLIELEHSVDPAYRMNARFMMADSSLKVIKKLKDSQNRPLWIPGYAMKEPDTINGYPYAINQDMPAMAANARSVAFGDFMNYFIRRVTGTQVMRLTERYADFNQTGFLAFQRMDGKLVDAGTHPIKYYANSAA